MPNYTYLCEAGHTFEEVGPLAKAPEGPACPTCGQATRRVPSGFTPVLKGRGFTQTFYPGRDHK